MDDGPVLPGGIATVDEWLNSVHKSENPRYAWYVLDDPLRLSLAQGWVTGMIEQGHDFEGQDRDALALALASRNGAHPLFPHMLDLLIDHWRNVYTDLRDGYGVLSTTILVAPEMELVVLTAPELVGRVEEGRGFPAHSFITRLSATWVISALARRLPVPGWPPTEQEVPGLLD